MAWPSWIVCLFACKICFRKLFILWRRHGINWRVGRNEAALAKLASCTELQFRRSLFQSDLVQSLSSQQQWIMKVSYLMPRASKLLWKPCIASFTVLMRLGDVHYLSIIIFLSCVRLFLLSLLHTYTSKSLSFFCSSVTTRSNWIKFGVGSLPKEAH